MQTTIIRNGRIVDPTQNIDGIFDLVIKDDLIAGILTSEESEKIINKNTTIIDAKGMYVFPGFIDTHVHVREPGAEALETIHTAARAAIAGGFSSIAMMPDTDPPVDNEASAEYVYLQSDRAGFANVFPIGALTQKREGEFLAEIGQLYYANAVAFSDAPKAITDTSVLMKAMQYCGMFKRTLFLHPEDPFLAGKGVMNSGYNSSILGLPTRPAVAEEVKISRDLYLSRSTQANVHFSPITTKGAVKLIKQAKDEGINATASVTPHHLLLTDNCVKTFNASKAKVLPPLRTSEHIEALKAGLQDGTIDVVCSTHTPCAFVDKTHDFVLSAFGVVGLETTVSLIFSRFVETGAIDLSRFVELFSTNPAKILRLSRRLGSLERGKEADITIFDPSVEWTIDSANFLSKSKNTAFEGEKTKGKARYVFVKGKCYDCNQL